MGTDNKCIVCNSPIRKGLQGNYCGNVCYAKEHNLQFGTKDYEESRQYYLKENIAIDKQNESYNQALLESGKLFIDHPEEVAHVEIKDGVVELKCVDPFDRLNEKGEVILDDFEAREEAKELKQEQSDFCGLPDAVLRETMKIPKPSLEQPEHILSHSSLSLILSAQKGDRGQAQKYIAEIGLDVIALLIRKNTDYGSSVFTSPLLRPSLDPLVAIDVRMSDKIKRIANLLEKPSSDIHVTEESVDTTLDDLCGYIILRKVVKLLNKDKKQ